MDKIFIIMYKSIHRKDDPYTPHNKTYKTRGATHSKLKELQKHGWDCYVVEYELKEVAQYMYIDKKYVPRTEEAKLLYG